MVPYYLPLLTALASALVIWTQSRVARGLIVLYVCLIAIVVIGMRGNVDIDYGGYLEGYNGLPMRFDFEEVRLQYGEILYNVFAGVFRAAGAPYWALVFATTLFSITVKGWALWKYSAESVVALAIYLCIAFLETETITVRWAVATSLIVLAIHFLRVRSFVAAAVCAVVAVGFHSFTLLYAAALPLLLLSTRQLVWVAIAASVMGVFFPMEVIHDYFIQGELETYLLNKIANYSGQDTNPVGIFSLLKMGFLASLVVVPYVLRPGAIEPHWTIRPALVFLAFAMLFFRYKVFFYRAAVLADFFFILAAVNMLASLRQPVRNSLYVGALTMFAVWSILDVSNHFKSDYITPYRFAPLESPFP